MYYFITIIVFLLSLLNAYYFHYHQRYFYHYCQHSYDSISLFYDDWCSHFTIIITVTGSCIISTSDSSINNIITIHLMQRCHYRCYDYSIHYHIHHHHRYYHLQHLCNHKAYRLLIRAYALMGNKVTWVIRQKLDNKETWGHTAHGLCKQLRVVAFQ